MDEQRRLGDKWREGDVEVARSLAVPVGQDKSAVSEMFRDLDTATGVAPATPLSPFEGLPP